MRVLEPQSGWWTPPLSMSQPNTPAPDTSKQVEPRSFTDTLKDAVDNVNKLKSEANKAVTDLAVGDSRNIHQTLIAMQKASISFSMMAQVRNKLVEAYREVMRMPV